MNLYVSVMGKSPRSKVVASLNALYCPFRMTSLVLLLRLFLVTGSL